MLRRIPLFSGSKHSSTLSGHFLILFIKIMSQLSSSLCQATSIMFSSAVDITTILQQVSNCHHHHGILHFVTDHNLTELSMSSHQGSLQYRSTTISHSYKSKSAPDFPVKSALNFSIWATMGLIQNCSKYSLLHE